MRSTEVRSDHLQAMVEYCYEQMMTSGGDIRVLDFGDNEQSLDAAEQLEYLSELRADICKLVASGHQDLQIKK